MDASDRARLEAVRDVWRTAPSVEDAVAAAEAAVARSAWFPDGLGCSPAPHGAELVGFAPGRALPGEPDARAGVVRVGFDERDRAVMATTFAHEALAAAHDVRFFDGDICRELRFDGGHRPVCATLFEYEQDRVVRQAVHAQADEQTTPTQHLWEYFYGADGRLERARARNWGWGDPETARLAAHGMTYTFEYDDTGKLSRITGCNELSGRDPVVIYRRRTKASSATRLAKRLVAAIEELVSQGTVDEQVWCLALHYEPESPFPPDVVFGVQREREAWGSDVDLLNPAEWDADHPPRRLQIDDPDLLDACASVWDALSTQDDGPARAAKLLNSIARRLNQSGLRGHLDVTEDFFVYAVDLELEDLDANLRAAVGAARYRRLVNAGLTSP